MELYGFARSGVAGEYSPSLLYAYLTADTTTSSTSYSTLLTLYPVIQEQGETLCVMFTASSRDTGGVSGAPIFQVTVDGTAYNGAVASYVVGGGNASNSRILTLSDLVPGRHTVTLDWKSATGTAVTISASSLPTKQHAALICRRDRPNSRRELDGFAMPGWPMIYTCGTASADITASKTSSSTTVTTPLFSGVQVQTRYPQSALLVRFTASGVGSGTPESAKFQLLVDGIARVGTGACSENASVFNAMFVCVVPVNAGIHKLDVNWAGGSTGCTIDPTVADARHAELSAEEVFCSDVNMLSDMEGFATSQYASKNLPRVGYASLQQDYTNGGGDAPLLDQTFYVSGDNSAILIEFTGSLLCNSVEPILRIVVDGAGIYGSTSTTSNGFVQCLCGIAAMNAAQGNHRVQIFFNGITSFTPVTNPEYSHANMVIREIASL